jgi:lipid-A-disaccharide synthase
MPEKIFIIAGEASGDHHAADLVKEIKALRPNLTFIGIGGDEMQKEGVTLLYHISQLAILGITEVLKHLPFIRKVMNAVKAELKKDVEAIILVDYPGFNLRVARIAKEVGVPVIYYISPQLWAWGEKRVEKMRRFVDLLLVIFQFEETFYKTHGITAHFVGHPLVDQIEIAKGEAQFRQENNIPLEHPIVGMLPGSRDMEVRNLLPVMVKTVEMLKQNFDFIPVLGRASQLSKTLYEEYTPADSDILLLSSQAHYLMRYSHAVMVASGTATLECGYLQTPMVVLYSVSPVTYWLGRMMIKIENIALANIVSGKRVVPEFIQKDITVKNISAALARYFSEPDYYTSVKNDLGIIQKALGDKGASKRAAEQVVSFLDSKR